MKSDFIDNPHNSGNAGHMTTDNKTLIQRALAELISTGDADTLVPLLKDDFVYHRPDATTRTKAEWLALVREGPLDEMKVEIDHVLADGDHVVMHSRRRIPGAGPGVEVVDIWRFDDGRIAEAWEIVEPATETAAHQVWWESDGR